jgi:glycosyltransferase involved in cell wall biosynthesis
MGVANKMRGIADSLGYAGLVVETLQLHSSSDRLGKQQRAIIKEALGHCPRNSAVLFRTNWLLALLTPEIIRLRMRGVRLILDIPTPLRLAPIESQHKASGCDALYEQVRSRIIKASQLLTVSLMDSVLTYGPDDRMTQFCMGQRESRVQNGVCVSRFGISRVDSEIRSNACKLLAVGCYGKPHGLDRLIRGLALMRSTGCSTAVRLIAVGSGPEKLRLEQLVERLGLQDLVVLRGPALGEELDRLFDWADLGVGCLATQPSGHQAGSAIKVREYLARGLPVLLDDTDVLVKDPATARFMYVTPSGCDPIDFTGLVTWWRQLDRAETGKLARMYAEQNLDFSVTHRTLLAP